MMLAVTLIIGLSLFFMVVTKKGNPTKTFFLWFIQFIVVLSVSIFILNLGVIDMVISTYGLLTILMLILVLLSNNKVRKESKK